MRVDLHMHSTASDGVYSPAEVVHIALTNQMDVIALTDHDNVAGLPEAWQAASGKSGESGKLEVLAGVELSSEDETADRHVIGYLVDVQNAALLAMLKEMRDSRV